MVVDIWFRCLLVHKDETGSSNIKLSSGMRMDYGETASVDKRDFEEANRSLLRNNF